MRRMLAAWVMGLCALGAQAQTAVDDHNGEATLACLERPARPPKYPAEALEKRTNGFYRVELTFTDAKRPPDVQVMFSAGTEDLRLAAEHYVKQFRLPCLAAGQKVTALQEVSFFAVNGGDVKAPASLNLPRSPDARLGACLRAPPEGLRLQDVGQLQTFKREPKTGNLVAELTFTAPDQPPQAKVLYDTLNSRHRKDVLAYVAEYRVPCIDPGERFVLRQNFRVGAPDGRGVIFKDVGIAQFLGMVRNAEARPVDFDLGTMACPFRLRVQLGRPAFPNRVAEVGEANANRRSFIAWMEELEPALTREEFENLLGKELFVDVPCGSIKLG